MGLLLCSYPTPSTCSIRQKDVCGIKLRMLKKEEACVSLSDSHKTNHLLFLLLVSISLSLSPLVLFSMELNERIEHRSKFKTICVFCGSKAGCKPSFGDAALHLGKLLVERKINLVYGGGSGGLMGLISQTVLNGGCHVLGVIPKALLPREISGETFGEIKTVAGMHERKSEMEKHADAFIALPGGYGTMEELLEMITWSQLGIHDKPVGLLNVDGYFDCLLALFDKGVEEGFIDNSARHIVIIANTAEDLIRKMEYAPLHDKVAPKESWEVDQQQLLQDATSGEPSNSDILELTQ